MIVFLTSLGGDEELETDARKIGRLRDAYAVCIIVALPTHPFNRTEQREKEKAKQGARDKHDYRKANRRNTQPLPIVAAYSSESGSFSSGQRGTSTLP